MQQPQATRTTCPYCGVGCGVLAEAAADGLSASIRGDPHHPANFGRLCSKGSALGETLTLDERLLHPEIGDRRASWDETLTLVARTFRETIDRHGPDSVAFYGSGQLLTEDYYVANKLMKGFIGSGNMDTNSRLCMASAVAGHKRAFGSDTVPVDYADLELADLVVLVGSNFAWCHPVLHQRLMAARQTRGTRIVVIDPRATSTTADADLHLALRPGSDVALFNGLLAHLAASPSFDAAFVGACTTGFAEALAAARPASLLQTALETGLSAADLGAFYAMVEATPRTVTVFSQGVNQSTSGTDKVNAIINTHLATGRIGKPGCGPFSITGQPNAMGGREVGGLANQLAAHMDFTPDAIDRVRRFWRTPATATQPGLKAVDLFEAVADGRVKALWIMATNPAVSMPDASKVRAAIAACPFVVVSDVIATGDTVKLAHVRLPATAWGEKSGTVTNSERRISRQRSFLKPPGECRHDWDILADVARRMGYPGFDFASPADIFREHAALSAFENGGARDFDIGAWSHAPLDAYEAMQPFQWPAPARGDPSPPRMFANGRFYTPDGRARFIATQARAPASPPDETFDLRLTTMRVRDHWHTMTRTGKTARLSQHYAEPFLEISPADAARLGIDAASIVEVASQWGAARLRALVTHRLRPGVVSAPMHWTARFAPTGRIDDVVNPATDPVSGQPELKHTPVRVRLAGMTAYAYVVSRIEPARPDGCGYWATARAPYGWRIEAASEGAPAGLASDLATALSLDPEHAIHVRDAAKVVERLAWFDDDGLVAALVAGRAPVEADRAWWAGLLQSQLPPADLRRIVLAGRPPLGEDAGPLVCACKGVGASAIAKAAGSGACDVSAIGRSTGAGVTCGSCKPEIARILERLLATPERRAAE